MKSVRGYTIYAIIGTVFEESLVFIVLYWILPVVGIVLPWWLIAVILLASIGFSCFTYYLGRSALKKKIITGTEAIIGRTGRVISDINPEGYIRVRGEVWKATADEKLNIDDEVTVLSVKGFMLTVAGTKQNRQP
jgi:membrane-bound serine protease (ClpP class)